MSEPGLRVFTGAAGGRIGLGRRAATGAILGGLVGAEMHDADRGKGIAAGCLIGAAAGFALGVALVSPLYSLWEGLTGAAAGKRFLGIMIANADGSRASVLRLMGRYLIKKSYVILLLMGLVLGSSGLRGLCALAGLAIFAGCFFVLSAHRQALHDKLARTAVFKADNIR
ncbi:MAG: RDD family protein [Planctomycetota bacterium]|nr:RDD family protein [Planctomycetota bacterium]